MNAHRADKRFGQNFLHDPGVLARIVAAIAPAPGDHLVEIGPGQGALSAPLAASGARLDLIEIDHRLVPTLRERFASQPQVHLHHADALVFDFASLAGDQPLRLVGNLPYNISSPLLFRCLDIADRVRDMHFMLQKEVVQRLVAEPGGKDYGRLSVAVAVRAGARSLFDVGPGAFRPAPKVTSSVVRITPLAAPPPAAVLKSLDALLRAGFGQRRKTLANTLGGLLGREPAAALLARCHIDPRARAETLFPSQWLELARARLDHTAD